MKTPRVRETITAGSLKGKTLNMLSNEECAALMAGEFVVYAIPDGSIRSSKKHNILVESFAGKHTIYGYPDPHEAHLLPKP
jgi:hypothetical protein